MSEPDSIAKDDASNRGPLAIKIEDRYNDGTAGGDSAGANASEPMASPGSSSSVAAASPLPSMKGQHALEGGVHFFRGQWAMSDAAHGLPGQTSDFEYRLVEQREGSLAFPVSGRYAGWFFLKHFAPKPGQVKIDEKEIQLTFKPNTDEEGDASKAFTVTGEGQNKFGKFSVHGTMSADGHLHLYKAYLKKPLPPGASTTPKTPRPAFAATGPAIVPTTPRESSGRVRKPSVAMLDVLETTALAASKQAAAASKGKQAAAAAATTTATTTPTAAAAGTGRAPRAAVSMQKCADLLREIMKHIQAAYFKEPVDYVKLCIPDYPDIIKEPMDFSTIQQNLDKSVYATPEAFADHMRLVFKNAVTYNQRRDHPVHIAARELSSKFEERYRSLMTQLNPMADYETNFKAAAVAGPGKKSTGPKARHSTGGGGGAGVMMRPGPREAVIPPALDAGMQTLIEMQRAMKGMQDELLQLRTQLRQSEIKSSVEVQRQAAQDPMTLEEKQALVDRINRLDEERMREIIEIVQEALPATANADNDDIDIPIDDLDTFTLRKMQAVVQRGDKEQVKRKRMTQPTGAKPGPKGKRPKTTPTPAAAPAAALPAAAPAHVVQPQLASSSSTFFGASADDAALTADEPLSMDTALPLSQEDYSDLILEVSEHVEATAVVHNASAWSADALKQHATSGPSDHAGSNNLRWSEDARASAAIRKLEEVAFRPAPTSFAAVGAVPVEPSSSYDEASALQRRREEERRAFQDMGRSVNLDQHRDAFYGEP